MATRSKFLRRSLVGIVASISTLLSPIYPALAQDHLYKDIRWGMSMNQVKSIEKEKLLKEDTASFLGKYGFLGYKGKVLSKDAHIFYIFDHNKLWKAEDYFVFSHNLLEECIQECRSVNEAISRKYGKPTIKEYWKNDHYRNDSTKKDLAVSLGDLTIVKTWETETTIISTTVQKGEANFFSNRRQITLVADYVSKQVMPAEFKNKRP